MGRVLLRAIVFGWACALSVTVLADEGVERSLLASNDAPSLFQEHEARPLHDDELEKLRGRVPAPTTLQQVGVVLWDEPRKPLPPQRSNGGEPHSLLNSNTGATLTVAATVSRQ